jgi:DNA helicase-2/ATP-dependent DNA helicase PcrA
MIHAYCLELLKSESPTHLKFEVLHEAQQGLFVDRDRNGSKSGLTTSTELTGALPKRYVDTSRYVTALSILREADRVDAQLHGCSLLQGLAAYQAVLDEKICLDYSSILEEAVTRLTNDDSVRARLAERVNYVIADEHQDVNPVQEAIVWSLHKLGARICVVGGNDQTIYQWRGGDVEDILTFAERCPSVGQIPIEENSRSSDGIVETARPFIEQNSVRLAKAMKPAGVQRHEAGDIVALSFADPDQEARHGRVGVRVKGVALFDRKNRRTEYKRADSGCVLAWYLDEDYDGDCFVDCQMFFDFKKLPTIKAALKAQADPHEFALRIESEPFLVHGYKGIAVKVVDGYGNESVVVPELW